MIATGSRFDTDIQTSHECYVAALLGAAELERVDDPLSLANAELFTAQADSLNARIRDLRSAGEAIPERFAWLGPILWANGDLETATVPEAVAYRQALNADDGARLRRQWKTCNTLFEAAAGEDLNLFKRKAGFAAAGQ